MPPAGTARRRRGAVIVSDATPSFFTRLFLAWIAYFRVLFDAEFAAGVMRLRDGTLALPPPEREKPEPQLDAKPEPKKEPEKKKEPPPVLREATPDAALPEPAGAIGRG